MTKTFYSILTNTLFAALVNTFVWFAATFWVYLETRSVLTTAVMAGVYSGTIAVTGFFLGSLVDRYPKKRVMLGSSAVSLFFYIVAVAIYVFSTPEKLTDTTTPLLWIFIVLTLFGALAGNVRTIALSTLVTVLVEERQRDRANGMVGTATGVAFLAASVFSGLAIGFLGMFWVLGLGVIFTALAFLHLWFIPLVSPASINPEGTTSEDAAPLKLDVRETIGVVRSVPGLFGLIFFQTFNNFLGGVFMALMDAYGLQLVSVQVWGILWGALSLGFIVGGLAVARWGLGPSPLRVLFLVNIVMWIICMVFPLQASIVLLAVGMFVWLCLIPVAEAAEQTILQTTIPPGHQGRVFGFAQSLEQAASPITAFMIGPIAQLIFIPFMTTGRGVELIGGWFGTGPDRGIALVFILAGVFGLIITLLAMRSPAYKKLLANGNLKRVGGEVTAEVTAEPATGA